MTPSSSPAFGDPPAGSLGLGLTSGDQSTLPPLRAPRRALATASPARRVDFPPPPMGGLAQLEERRAPPQGVNAQRLGHLFHRPVVRHMLLMLLGVRVRVGGGGGGTEAEEPCAMGEVESPSDAGFRGDMCGSSVVVTRMRRGDSYSRPPASSTPLRHIALPQPTPVHPTLPLSPPPYPYASFAALLFLVSSFAFCSSAVFSQSVGRKRHGEQGGKENARHPRPGDPIAHERGRAGARQEGGARRVPRMIRGEGPPGARHLGTMVAGYAGAPPARPGSCPLRACSHVPPPPTTPPRPCLAVWVSIIACCQGELLWLI